MRQSIFQVEPFFERGLKALRQKAPQLIRYLVLLALTIASCLSAAPASADDLVDAFAKADYKKAFEIAMPRAEAGDARSQVMVGSLYSYGRGVPQSFAKAEEWFRRGAEQGDAVGEYALGMFYRVGVVVDRDDKAAFVWLKKAADQDNVLALLQIARMYREGAGTSQDLVKAADCERRGTQMSQAVGNAILNAITDGQ